PGCAEDKVRFPGLVRRLASESGAQARDDEAGARGRNTSRLGSIRKKVPGGNESSRACSPAGAPRGALQTNQFLSGVLLRERRAPPSVRAARASGRERRLLGSFGYLRSGRPTLPRIRSGLLGRERGIPSSKERMIRIAGFPLAEGAGEQDVLPAEPFTNRSDALPAAVVVHYVGKRQI